MKRFITEKLEEWKDSPRRKPLVLRGARQVGKTYIVRKFAEDCYENLAYFNFDHDARLASLFADTKDPVRILEQLSVVVGMKITPGETLIFFDEVQECGDALNSLKYFCEFAPEYHIIAAGSLLGVRLAQTSFPVGKVNFLDMHPMSFSEFLLADGQESLVEYMQGLDAVQPVPEAISVRLEEKLRTYCLVGGMPEVVASWVAEKDIALVRQIQAEILQSYEEDFSKHTSAAEANKISLVWHSVASQLAKENKKFVYQAIREGARAREYEGALNWLRDAGLIYKVSNVTAPKLPLMAYEDLGAFKIYLLDVGLLSNIVGVEGDIILDKERIFTEFKGVFAENYVLQSMKVGGEKQVYYYTFDRHEVDFMYQSGDAIYPVEVKSGARASHKSLTSYIDMYQPKLAVRFSTNNLVHDGKILNIPLYLADYYQRLVEVAR
ncbi:ATP-binding protein [Candidatus Saccharibacteria bacterium]|nr:ATP-binding protein [Candidatus Saccharibacteria bacterium]